LVDTNLLIDAAEHGSVSALKAIRASRVEVPSSVAQEFLNNVSTHGQRASRQAFLKAEGVKILSRSEAHALRATAEFQQVFAAARSAGHSVADAELAGLARASGRTAITAEKRLTNFLNLTQPKHGVRIRRVK
jgi:predicted nucleic acid-binding protein